MSNSQATYSTDFDEDAEGNPTDDAENFNITKFEELLNRLEGSKKRQQRQRSVEGRRDIFAQGLAGMMSNF
jgi:hypothetical protein